ncbi:PREDICTED: proline-serine-threonine phosphatase-interacting protein 1-like [Amphimedon queenslandica]|uniref:SH3 domain-containing protein n=1 Tax=Amphimedon queenslandica TaxID=400682 RepID=A0A1X7U934_AMPQE|nr:PREDICTED: proline-serine-threonine phosphatase-interacting protein 1-like [Amphimedon queenslandica]|eukprot:XP_003388698.1 PREDICTED: proline-serine-threonine phosphatase-interacting protein 1-like [Amphimedon queenslandica]
MANGIFCQNFWGSDFCSTQGYDVLVKRLKEGKQVLVDYEEYLEKRAKIEKQYAEEIVKLAKNTSGKDELGTMKKCWDQIRAETETTGRLHMQLSLRLQDEVLKSVRDFRNQQKEVRKKTEDTVKRSAVHKKNCYDKNNRLRSYYEGKCRESDKAQDQLRKLETNPLTKPKDHMQAHKKAEVAKTASNNADVQYQEAVKTLEEARMLWEREMELMCHKFQELEEQRLAFLRHQMWTYTNFCSQTLVDDDESLENIRKSLENCNIDEDIELFVKDRSTGSERPATIPYENFYNPRAVIAGVPTAVSLEAPHKELPPLPPDEDNEIVIESTYSVPQLPEAHYSVPRSGGDYVIALYDYDAQGDQEISLKEGDVLEVVGKEDDIWWCGKFINSGGKLGMFPAAYVEPYVSHK